MDEKTKSREESLRNKLPQKSGGFLQSLVLPIVLIQSLSCFFHQCQAIKSSPTNISIRAKRALLTTFSLSSRIRLLPLEKKTPSKEKFHIHGQNKGIPSKKKLSNKRWLKTPNPKARERIFALCFPAKSLSLNTYSKQR